MKIKYFWGLIFAIAAAALFIFFGTPFRSSFINDNASQASALSLITEPDDGIAPVLAMISGAAKSADLVMYELDDHQVEAALVADERRGVAVRVILGAGYDGASSTQNAAAYEFLAANSVPVRWSPSYFSLTHQKSLAVDHDRALIMTFNLVSKYYPTGRDFGVDDNDPRDVAAIERTFDDDWRGTQAGGGGAGRDAAAPGGNNGDHGDDLIWSPGSERPLLTLIHGAQKSLYVYNEEMADGDVVKALIEAAERGVQVYVDMTDADEWQWQFRELTTGGVHVRTYADSPSALLYIHAKMIVADGARAFVGSENFSTTSLDDNRELGIITSDPAIIASLTRTFAADWRNAIPFMDD